MKISLIAWALTGLLATSSIAHADPLRDAVVEGISERLQLMKPVAAWKMANNAPVEDLEREAVVLERSGEAASKAGLVGTTALPFFQAQMDAAKDIQECWIARWQGEEEPPVETPDLVEEIRPQLLEIGARQLQDIRTAIAHEATFDFTPKRDDSPLIDVECLSPEARDQIFQELAKIQLAP